MNVRGVSYAVGEPADTVRRDMRVIREDLHCTTVMLIGTDTAHQTEAAEQALAAGLNVYIRPYLADRSHEAILAHLSATAAAAEKLRTQHPGRITLLVGSEFSLTAPGMLPGPRVFIRLQVLVRPRWRRLFDRRITRKLNALLAAAVTNARRSFHGPISYTAGYWENVDWSGFDLIGVNLYHFGDPADYEKRLHTLVQNATKPVVITEFGCGAHIGAEHRGPGSFRIVNWFATPPRIKDGQQRDEDTQATYLTQLTDLYATNDVHGCFGYTFISPGFPHHPDPRYDLDMAGFGLVKTSPNDPAHREAKKAFHAVAQRYNKA